MNSSDVFACVQGPDPQNPISFKLKTLNACTFDNRYCAYVVPPKNEFNNFPYNEVKSIYSTFQIIENYPFSGIIKSLKFPNQYHTKSIKLDYFKDYLVFNYIVKKRRDCPSHYKEIQKKILINLHTGQISGDTTIQDYYHENYLDTVDFPYLAYLLWRFNLEKQPSNKNQL